MRVTVLSLIIVLFFFNSNKAYSGTLTMPTTLTTDTTDFVLLSSSGTTPSISGYTGTLLVSAVASDGNIKVTSVTNLMQAAGYCDYSSDNSSAPSKCTGNSLTDGSDIQANYVGNTTKYNTTIDKNFSSMIIFETGFDWFFDNGWNIKSVISRTDKDGVGHENLLELRAVRSRQNLY